MCAARLTVKESETMLQLIALIKNLICYALPIYLVHLYLKHSYGTGAWQTIRWWAKNWGGLEHPGITLTFTILPLLFIILTMSHLANRVYLSTVGEQHRLVYLGNDGPGAGRYLPRDEPRSEPFTYLSDVGYNMSFDDIYRTELFIKDRGTDTAGTPVKEFRMIHFLGTVAFILVLWLVFMSALHLLAHPVSVAVASGGTQVEQATMESFDEQLRYWHLNRGTLLAIGFGAVVMGCVGGALSRTEFGARAYPLPSTVRPGNKLTGVPVYRASDFEHRQRMDGEFDSVRTRYRFVTLKFTDGFPMPAYVTTRFHTDEHPGLFDRLKDQIKNEQPIEVRVDDAQRIRIERQ